jgi:hypothetical protein
MNLKLCQCEWTTLLVDYLLHVTAYGRTMMYKIALNLKLFDRTAPLILFYIDEFQKDRVELNAFRSNNINC